MKKLILFFITSTVLLSCSHKAIKNMYPEHWWKPVPKKDLQWWEIGPASAKEGEVVLSKRNELGVLSNFADTPFVYMGKKYATVEGLWQSMKYPTSEKDPRFKLAKWPYKREDITQMSGFPAKKAGDFGSKVMKKNKIDWVSFGGRTFKYRTQNKGTHYQIIREAMMAKLEQNPKVKEVLLATGCLVLKPDHITKPNDPPAWKYFDIWMEIRASLPDSTPCKED